MVIVVFSPALADADCWSIDMSGMIGSGTGLGFAEPVVLVRPLRGDIDRNGITSTGDASIIKPKFGEVPTDAIAVFDFNSDGVISTGDAPQIKPLFGNAVAVCP